MLPARFASRSTSERGTPPARSSAREGVDAVAVCFLHSYANPDARAHRRRHRPQARCPMLRFAVARNSARVSRVRTHVDHGRERLYRSRVSAATSATCSRSLDALGFRGELAIMQSNGGVMSPPSRGAASGDDDGIRAGRRNHRVGASWHGARLSADVVSFDMGGTTAKASLVRGGEPTMARRLLRRRLCQRASGDGAGGRCRRSRRGRRQHRLDRRSRRAEGRPAKRRRRCPGRSAIAAAASNRPSPTPT